MKRAAVLTKGSECDTDQDVPGQPLTGEEDEGGWVMVDRTMPLSEYLGQWQHVKTRKIVEVVGFRGSWWSGGLQIAHPSGRRSWKMPHYFIGEYQRVQPSRALHNASQGREEDG